MFGFLTRTKKDDTDTMKRIDELDSRVRQLQRENTELRLDMDNLREKVMRKMSGAGRPPKTERDIEESPRSGVIPWHQSS